LRAMETPMAPSPMNPTCMPESLAGHHHTTVSESAIQKNGAATFRLPPPGFTGDNCKFRNLSWCRRARCARWYRAPRAPIPRGRAVRR
jgi:hypothetical protein